MKPIKELLLNKILNFSSYYEEYKSLLQDKKEDVCVKMFLPSYYYKETIDYFAKYFRESVESFEEWVEKGVFFPEQGFLELVENKELVDSINIQIYVDKKIIKEIVEKYTTE